VERLSRRSSIDHSRLWKFKALEIQGLEIQGLEIQGLQLFAALPGG
jgi:hypothetical protein